MIGGEGRGGEGKGGRRKGGEGGRGVSPPKLKNLTPPMLTCMNDLTGAKVLTGERILFDAVKDIYFTSKMKFEKLYLIKRSKKMFD
jgi:hypothetical protein